MYQWVSANVAATEGPQSDGQAQVQAVAADAGVVLRTLPDRHADAAPRLLACLPGIHCQGTENMGSAEVTGSIPERDRYTVTFFPFRLRGAL